MADEPKAVPLVEQLRSVPVDAKLRIDTPNALGRMDTRSIPVGRMCHEAADAIGVRGTLAGPDMDAAWEAFQSFPIDHAEDSDEQQRKAVEAAVRAAYGVSVVPVVDRLKRVGMLRAALRTIAETGDDTSKVLASNAIAADDNEQLAAGVKGGQGG